jgi:hypothetical protein
MLPVEPILSHVFLLGTFFLATSNKWFSQVPLETTVRNKVPSENILTGFLFLKGISRGT